MRKICLLTLTLLVSLPACRAEDSIKQGIEGEFCNNRDDDCRDGHICQDGVCRATDAAGTISCAQMCARLDACDAGDPDCEVDCRATIQGTCLSTPCPWSDEAVDAFGLCITEGLTCSEIQAADAPQECYRQIPLDQDRQDRCDAFIAAVDRCGDADTTELRNRCYRLGRTATDASWLRTDGCVDRVAGGDCSEIADCFNAVFELEDELDLGDGAIDVDPN